MAWHAYVYATEVPEGYQRVDFYDLQEDKQNPAALGKTITGLVGKKIFIKGYMYPGNEKNGITSFVFCRDKGDCCFGGNPKVTERILVTLDDPKGISLTTNMVKLSGTFRFERISSSGDIGQGEIWYHLDGGTKR